MSTQATVRVLALLAVVAQAGTLALLAAFVAKRARWSIRLRQELAPWSLWLAAAVAAVAMGGSLWFSESAGFVPCTLCWYQRIAMYPLAVLLTVAAIRHDQGVRLPAAILAAVGAAISILHLVEQWRPHVDLGVCDAWSPCSARWVTELGYLTIPAMALSAFAFILVLMFTRNGAEA